MKFGYSDVTGNSFNSSKGSSNIQGITNKIKNHKEKRIETYVSIQRMAEIQVTQTNIHSQEL